MKVLKSKLVMACLKKQDLQRRFELLKEESEELDSTLKELAATPELREYIISLLGSGPRLSEDTQRSIDHPMKVVSEGTEKVVPVDVSGKYFDPETDDWVIVGIEENPEEHQYRIQVEAIKNRGYIGPSMYTMDTFWTPWFKLGPEDPEN